MLVVHSQYEMCSEWAEGCCGGGFEIGAVTTASKMGDKFNILNEKF